MNNNVLSNKELLYLDFSIGNLSLLFQGVEREVDRKFSCLDITSFRLNPVLFQAENEVMYFCSFLKLPLNYLPPSCVLASTLLLYSQESLT